MAKTPGQERFRRRQKELQKEIVKGKSLKGAKVAVRERQEGELQREIAGSPKAIAQRSENIETEREKIKEVPQEAQQVTQERKTEVAQEPVSKVEKFIGEKVNPPLKSFTEFLGADFKKDEQGKLSLTSKGLKELGTRAAITGSIGGFGASGLALSTTSKAVLTSIAGGSGIMTWLASDNLLSSMNIFTRDVRESATFGQISPEDATAKIDEAQQFIDQAKTFINTNTALNPLLWPFRKLIMTNVEASQFTIDNNREMIDNLKGGVENG